LEESFLIHQFKKILSFCRLRVSSNIIFHVSQTFINLLSLFLVSIGAGDKPMVDVQVGDESKIFSPEEVSAMVRSIEIC
jgi:hypothetical protein